MPGWFKVNINGLLFEQVGSHQLDVLLGFDGRQGGEFYALGENPTTWPASLPQFDRPLIFLSILETQPLYDLLFSDAPPASLDMTRADLATGTAGASSNLENMYLIQFALTQQLPTEVIIVPDPPEPTPQPVPEPGTLSLLALGLATAGFGGFVRCSRGGAP